MPFHFANVLLFSATAVLFVFGSLVAGHFLRPRAPNREKGMIYECGEKPIGQAWFNFNPRFYIVALIFLGASNAENMPLTLLVANLSNSIGGEWHALMAAAFISMAVPLAVFLALQRYFVRGITGGAVKG